MSKDDERKKLTKKRTIIIICMVVAVCIFGIVLLLLRGKKEEPYVEEESENFKDTIMGVSFEIDILAMGIEDLNAEKLMDKALMGLENFEGKEYAVPGSETTYKVVVGYTQYTPPSISSGYESLCNLFKNYSNVDIIDKELGDDWYIYKCKSLEKSDMDTDFYMNKDGCLVICFHPSNFDSIDIKSYKPVKIDSTPSSSDSNESDEVVAIEGDYREILTQILEKKLAYDDAYYAIIGEGDTFNIGSKIHDGKDVTFEVEKLCIYKGKYIALRVRMTNNLSEDIDNFVTADMFSIFDGDKSLNKKYMAGGDEKQDLAMKNTLKGQTTRGYIFFKKPKKDKDLELRYSKLYQLESENNSGGELNVMTYKFNTGDLMELQ